MPITSLDCYLFFWPISYTSDLKLSIAPSLGLIHWLVPLTGLRKPAYSQDYLFIIKDIIKGHKSTDRWRDGQGEVLNQRSFCPRGAQSQAQWHVEGLWITSLETLWMEALPHKHRWLNQWLLVPDSSSSPLFSPIIKGVGLKSLTFWSRLVPWPSDPTLRRFAKIRLINLTKDTIPALST